QPLNHQLTDLGAVLCARTTTAPEYRLFALDTSPPKPGLLRASGGGGAAIEVEVWALDAAGLGAFVAAIPAPLGVGKVALADGVVKGSGREARDRGSPERVRHEHQHDDPEQGHRGAGVEQLRQTRTRVTLEPTDEPQHPRRRFPPEGLTKLLAGEASRDPQV